MKTKWNLKLLYKSPKDPQIERDVRTAESLYSDFEKKYRGKNFTRDENALLKSLKDYEKLASNPILSKSIRYFGYIKCLNSEDTFAQAQIRLLSERLTKAGNKIQFFALKLGKIPKNKQKTFLKCKRLVHYKYMLELIFQEAKYNLTEPEERILSLKSATSHGMWTSGVSSAISKREVQHGGKKLPISEAIQLASNILNTKKRRDLSNKVGEIVQEVADFAESEINAVYTNKKINDELRKLPKPYTATLLSDEIDEKTFLALVKAVSSNFHISRRFFKLKAKLLGVKHLEYVDSAARIGQVKTKYTFKNSVKILKELFKRIDLNYEKIFSSFVRKGQIDVFPQKGKNGGGFCSPTTGLPTYILLNHVNDLSSISTMAHEMGHAVHYEMSKEQPVFYDHCTIASTEVASTLFEDFLYEDLLRTLKGKDEIIALHDYIQENIATIFVQIAYLNFEIELHNLVREKGWVAKEEMAKMYNKHMKALIGPLYRPGPYDGYRFMRIPHFRYFFYVYTYSLGQLVSKVLGARYREDNEYIHSINKFLRAGKSKSFEEIFGSIGVNVKNPRLLIEGLKSIEADIKKLEQLTN
jgi:oligoendopeptidase F